MLQFVFLLERVQLHFIHLKLTKAYLHGFLQMVYERRSVVQFLLYFAFVFVDVAYVNVIRLRYFSKLFQFFFQFVRGV